jgi:hypothetical protein
MSKSRSELVNRIAVDLDLVGAGQDAEAEDFADIDSRLDTHIATLNAREIVNVSDLDEVQDELFEPIVEWFVLKLGSGFGKPAADPVAVEIVEDTLKEVCRLAPRAARSRPTQCTAPALAAPASTLRRANDRHSVSVHVGARAASAG